MSRNQVISSKFSSTSKQSGEVTAALSSLAAATAKEAYTRIQDLEAQAVAAATAEQVAVADAERAAAAFDAARKQVRLLNAACVDICAVEEIVSAEHFTVMDKGDDAGLARRLEPEIRRVAGYGSGLADALAQLVRELQAAEAEAQRAKDALTTAMRELDSAILNLQGAVAQGRAVLATFGVKLTRKTKKKNSSTNNQVAAQPGPQPTLVPAAA